MKVTNICFILGTSIQPVKNVRKYKKTAICVDLPKRQSHREGVVFGGRHPVKGSEDTPTQQFHKRAAGTRDMAIGIGGIAREL